MNWLNFFGVPALRQIPNERATPARLNFRLPGRGTAGDGAVSESDIDKSKTGESKNDERALPKQTQFKRSFKKSVAFVSISCISCLLGVYLALFPPLAPDLWNFILFPATKGRFDMSKELTVMSDALHCQCTDLFFAAPDGACLHAYYFSLPGAKKTALVSHGKGGVLQHRLPLAYMLIQAGCSVFLYDYEGYGESTGTANLTNVCQDCEAAFDYLTSRLRVNPANIILYGESMGTGVSCEVSRHRPAGALILQSGFASLYEAGIDTLPLVRLYPRWCFPSPQMDNAEILKGPHPPLLLIHGQKDVILPCRYSEQIMAAAAEPKKLLLLPDADHNDFGRFDVEESLAALKDFIAGLN